MTSSKPPAGARLTQLRIAGMRVIEDITLDLTGLTVLIGDNGTGKSSILEALELLRMASQPVSFGQDVLASRHGGFAALLRRGAPSLRLGCRVRDVDGIELDYELELRASELAPVITVEKAFSPSGSDALPPYSRFPSIPPTTAREDLLAEFSKIFPGLQSQHLAMGMAFRSHPILARLQPVLESIAVHVPFETRPFWQLRDLDIRESPRLPCTVERTTKLSRYGTNLANAFQELRNRGGETWERVVGYARLGIRHDIREFRIVPARRGEIELEVVFGNEPGPPLPVDYLSEGQLSYLAMIALCELSGDSSLLAFDEPEGHLHPELLARVMTSLEELSRSVPIVLSTHSDQLLDCLADPAASVILCDLDACGAVRLRRPNKDALDRWLEAYRGMGSVRAEGSIEQLFDEPADEGPK